MSEGTQFRHWYPYVHSYGFYDPVVVGSIDGTDDIPHDRAIVRALKSSYKLKFNKHIDFSPERTIFIGRLPYSAEESTVCEALQRLLTSHREHSSRYHVSSPSRFHSKKKTRERSRSPFSSRDQSFSRGRPPYAWPKIRLVRDIVTGYPRGYGFAYFETAADADLLLDNWLHQFRNFQTRGASTKPEGLAIPNGEKVILEPAFAATLPGWRPRRLGGGLGGRKEAGQLRFGGVARPFRRPFTVSKNDSIKR